jgi:hypothetical protein
VVVLKEARGEGELIAIRAQTIKKNKFWTFFSGDSFPVPFPSALSFPLSFLLGSALPIPYSVQLKIPLDLSTLLYAS